ncbi:hypothetical protein AS594_39455 [Streptomyces agglomeratus]|uniref:Uncharacterized protein n=1 Tax=Streptomyces agglomeratus TaxID=285458 RepID=A0A1E5NZ62_9ACTN|nr:hypothetical protein [Streptomyces agglomeratus]OEJ21607.1 hypothetical protein AS594_39455 [Streptomyces agglomeratus]
MPYGLGADSTAILLMFLADSAAHGLEPDLSDLIAVHAITVDEFVDSLDYVNRLVLPLLRTRSVRLVQVCRGGKSDIDGVLVLDDSRTPRRIHAAGPWRLSDELRAAGTVPQLANGQRRCSIRFKGWDLDNWAAAEFGARTFRRVIGYHADELGRAEKGTAIQHRLNTEAGRIVCEPRYRPGWTGPPWRCTCSPPRVSPLKSRTAPLCVDQTEGSACDSPDTRT